MNLARLMDELAASVQPVIDRAFPYPVEKPEPPALVVAWPELVTYDGTYQRGMDQYSIPLYLVVGRGGVERAKRDSIAAWIDSDIKASIEAYAYTDSPVVVVTTAEIDTVELSGVTYLAIKFMVQVAGTGVPSTATAAGPPFNSTAELVAYWAEQNTNYQTSWMPCNPTSDTRDDAYWTLGQDSAFINPDTSDSQGFWYNNGPNGGPPFVETDYLFVADADDAYSGSGYLLLTLTQDYLDEYGAEVWRTLDQEGNEFPAEHRCQWRMAFDGEITYDHQFETLPDVFTDGFTNLAQVYRTLPSQAVLLLAGAGRDLALDSEMRWHFDLKDLDVFDLDQVTTPSIPVDGSWVHMEMAWNLSADTDGYWRVWQDGTLILDYSGPTVSDPWTKYGISWNVYGHLLGQTEVNIKWDEVMTMSVPAYDKLVLPHPTGGLG